MQYLLAHSSSNSKSYKASEFQFKKSVTDFLGRNLTDFHLPKCKVEHEIEDSISAANAFLLRPYLFPERVVSSLAKFK